ncbi:phage tail tube protein [Kitasatospora sp. NPDC088346]|uniref:phage tail tube protein n=1 Tax=Kitasatospora sp. NPDC088346 TaxID=3364073 RepID=UPI00382F3FF0
MATTTRPIDARGWLFEVQDISASTETWLRIGMLTSFSHNPGENEETEETTSFDDEGHFSQDVMQRGATIELESKYAVDKTGVQDAGQAYVDNVWAYRLGVDSHNPVRWRHRSQTKWVVWDATCTPGEQGGGTNEKTSWSATVTRCGKPTTAPVTPPAGGGS